MLKKFLLLVFTLVTILRGSTFAEDDFQTWTSLALNIKIPESKFKFYTEGQPRIGDDSHYIERLLYINALGYQISRDFTLWAGFAWAPAYMNASFQHDFNNEERIYQQLTYTRSYSSIELIQRIRIEERDISHVKGQANRIRYGLRASIPLYELEDKSTGGLSLFDEYFYNLNSAAPTVAAGPDRNWLFSGTYWKNNYLRIDLGYLLETAERVNRSDRHLHIVSTYVTFSI